MHAYLAGYVRIKKTVSRLTHLYGLILSYVIYSMFGGKLLSAILRPVIPVQTIQDLVTLDFTFFSIPTAKTVVFNGKVININNIFEKHKYFHAQKI